MSNKEKKEKKDKGCVGLLLIGLLIGFLTGFTIGVNVTAWKAADIIKTEYAEVITDKDGDFYINNRGLLYKLVPVKSIEEDKIDEVIELLEEHDNKG